MTGTIGFGLCKQRFTRGYKRYKETSDLTEWKIGHIFRDRRKFCVIDVPRQYENLRLSQE